MAEFIEALASDLTASGVGVRYGTGSGVVSIQLNYRRDVSAEHVALLMQTGGLAFPHKGKEQQGIQVLVDSNDLVSGQTIARQIHDQFHERTAETISGHEVLWLRATTLPQAIPVGPAAGQPERFQFSVNFEALIKLSGGS